MKRNQISLLNKEFKGLSEEEKSELLYSNLLESYVTKENGKWVLVEKKNTKKKLRKEEDEDPEYSNATFDIDLDEETEEDEEDKDDEEITESKRKRKLKKEDDDEEMDDDEEEITESKRKRKLKKEDDDEEMDDDEEEITESKRKRKLKKEDDEDPEYSNATFDIDLDEEVDDTIDDLEMKDEETEIDDKEIEDIFGDDIKKEDVQKLAKLFKVYVAKTVNEKLQSCKKPLKESLNKYVDKLNTVVDKYVTYTIKEQWLKENKIALTESIKNNINDDFMSGLQSLFQEHFVNVPKGKENLVEKLEKRIHSLESKLNEQIECNIKFYDKICDFQKKEIVTEATDGLSEMQKNKFQKIVENIEFTDADSYKSKIEVIKESMLDRRKNSLKIDSSVSIDNELKTNKSPIMESYVKALKR